MKLIRKLATFLVLVCFTTAVAQTTTCAPIVEQALAAVQQDCATLGRNQACYGFVSLAATPRANVQNFNFTKDGDLVNVADIDTLRLSRLDTVNNTWGIALMKLQANLPDTLPGQNVTILMFGDVQIQNAVAPSAAAIQVTANGRANIRSTPSTSGAIIGTMSGGETTAANGRNADSSWLRIQIPDSSALGWVSAPLVTASGGDVSTLPVVDSTAAAAPTPYTPMQAFYFSSGITQTSCAQAPADGILIQTPHGAGQINLRANDVDIQLGSTAFLQAQASGVMTVSVVEGEGHITANGTTVDVPAGTQTTIPLDANLRASGVPSDPQPYDAALVQPLPVQLLPLQITIAPPAVAAATPEVTATATPEATAAVTTGGGPYQVVKVMNLGGETLAGTICAVDQPFAVTMNTPRVGFAINFAPSGATQGTWTYSYAIAGAGETDNGSGTYTISDPAADGSRSLTLDGSDVSKFNGGGGTFPLHYVIGLTPASTC